MSTLILSGFGTNCEKETRHACVLAGAPPDSVHVRHMSEIYTGALHLSDYRFLVLIGGFLDGDDLGSGRACANRFRYRSMPDGHTFLERMREFVADGGLALGICNGFQLLVRLGLLPDSGKPDSGGPDSGKPAGAPAATVTLTNNASGRFEDRWVHLRSDPASACVFTRGLESIELPVRHGEGRVQGVDAPTLERLVEQGQVPLRYANAQGQPTEDYPANPNGSPHGIAALSNASGTVMGLMPHPEAFHHYTSHPRWTRRDPDQARSGGDAGEVGEGGEGLVFFRNAYAYLRENG